MSMRARIGPGDRAPDFTLPDQDGRSVHLRDLLARGPAVVYFYPKDHTPGCTVEACAFRDQYAAFQGAGATVIGVSADPIDRHRDFIDRHNLPFTLLSDATGAVRASYGVRNTFGFLPGRCTFVIDQ